MDVPEYAREAAVAYRKMLRRLKELREAGVEPPPELAASLLALHHNALLVWMVDNRPEMFEKGGRR